MCLVMTNPVDVLAVRHVKQGIEAGGFRTGHPSNYYLLLSNPNIRLLLCDYWVLGQIKTHVALKGEPSLSTKNVLS